MAALAAMSLGLMTQTTFAEGFYIGAGINHSELKAELEEELPKFKDDDLGFKIFAGFSFNKYLALEFAYLDAGTLKENDFADVEGLTVKVPVEAFTGSFVGSLPINDMFSIYARAGVAAWEAKAKAKFEGETESTKEKDEDLLYGLGAALNLGEQFQVRLEWEGIDVQGGSFNTFGLNALYKF
jgi:OOP family OmpA-OmpF porin